MKNLKFLFYTLAVSAFIFTACEKDQLLNEEARGTEKTTAQVSHDVIDFSRITFDQDMLVFESREHVAEVLEQIQQSEITNEVFQRAFPGFRSFQSEYLSIMDEHAGDFKELQKHTHVLISFEEEEEMKIRPIMPFSFGLALIYNANATIIVNDDVIKTTADKDYILDRNLAQSQSGIDELIKKGNVKKVFNIKRSDIPGLELSGEKAKLDDCSFNVPGQNRRLKAEIGYTFFYLAVYAYGESKYEKKFIFWWVNDTYNSCSVSLFVQRELFNDTAFGANVVNNNDDTVETSVFLGNEIGVFHLENFTTSIVGLHSASVTYNGTNYGLPCINVWTD